MYGSYAKDKKSIRNLNMLINKKNSGHRNPFRSKMNKGSIVSAI